MAEYRIAEDYIPKFLFFLMEKGIIKNYELKKDLARSIYMEVFKPANNIKKFSFSKMFSFMKFFGIIKHNKTTDMMTFHSEILNNITPETNIMKRKKFKIAPLLKAQQTSKTTPKPVDTPSPSSKSSKQKKETSNLKDCKICNLRGMSDSMFEQHQNNEKHKIRMDYVAKTKSNSNSIQGIFAEIMHGNGGGAERIFVEVNQSTNIRLTLFNRTPEEYTILKIVEIVKIKNPTSQVDLQEIVLPYLLAANSQLAINIQMLFSENMFKVYPIIFKLQKTASGEAIDVLKEMDIDVNSLLVEELRSAGPYQKPEKPTFYDISEEIVPGEHPDKKETDFKPKFFLAKYALPDNVIKVLNADLKEFPGMTFQQKNVQRDIKILLAKYDKVRTLNKENYFKILELSLMMEEHQMKINIRKYDTEGKELTSRQGYKPNCLELTVPGLAEHRPSVLRGDSVFVKLDQQSNMKYEGIVHQVIQNSVILGFSRKFVNDVYIKKQKYCVSFTFNRITLRAEHQAIEFVKTHNVIQLLCSEKITTKPLKDNNINWYNPNIENNIKQQQAVHYILSETSRPMPYLIFGPPGTGKTVTVVEAIMQIWKIKTSQNILVCAPSNSAANEIMKRLVKHNIPQRDLFRYIAPSYPSGLIDEAIKTYTNFNGDYYHPSIEDLLKYRIVVTTLVTASRLVNGGTPCNHFSYVFIDESGQATESETLIPIAGILTSKEKPGSINGQIVLAGDPKQLGPIIHSKRAERCGFGISMLERLMTANPIYRKNENQYNDCVLTKLVKSYRSHPAILNLPNTLFYEGELVPAGETLLSRLAENWEELPNKKFPIIFHSILGKDEQEENSPSFFNLHEVTTVISYLEKLIGNRLSGKKITEEHIGVIAPYRKQVQKLVQACKKKPWQNLNIGSVEQFQGQERLIIIVSTVRSKPEFMEHDEKFHLGFLKNPKRFNVAITRAKALLIVVGNPKILQYDEYWHAFIKYCKDNEACTGAPFDLSVTHENDATTNCSVMINSNASAEDGPSFSRGNV